MSHFLSQLYRDERGQGLTEYSLILAVIAIVAVVVLTLMGDKIKAVFNTIVGKLTSAQGYTPAP